MEQKKVVLAFSGGLDTSIAIPFLKEKEGAEVITVTLDVGGPVNPELLREKSLKYGAIKHYAIDAKEEFAKNYVFQAIKANALYEGKYPVSSSLSRPLIAKYLVEIAKKEEANILAHACTGKGNDQVRFDVTIKALAGDIKNLKIVSPPRDYGLTREWEIDYGKERGIEVVSKESPYSIDENLFGRSVECGEIEYPEKEPPADAFEWTVPPEDAPDKPEYVTITFEKGEPMALNGEKLSGSELLTKFNKIGGAHGVGRIDHMEDRLVGIKSREVYEAPAATVLIEAHHDLEKLVLTRHELLFKQLIDAKWVEMVYNGLWVEPLMGSLNAFINEMQKRVNGTVKVKLYKGSCIVVGRSSPNSLYSYDLATYNIDSTFDQTAAKGFIELWGLPSIVAAQVKEKQEQKERENKN